MHPCIWGPSAWKFLHAITFNYSEHPSDADRQAMIVFFRSLPSILPCELCANHLQEHYKSLPPEDHLADRKTVVKWLFDIHNEVNKSLNKPIKDFNEFISETKKEADYYRNKPLNMVCSKSVMGSHSGFLWGIIIVLVGLLIASNMHRLKIRKR